MLFFVGFAAQNFVQLFLECTPPSAVSTNVVVVPGPLICPQQGFPLVFYLRYRGLRHYGLCSKHILVDSLPDDLFLKINILKLVLVFLVCMNQQASDHSTVHTNSAVRAATDTGEELEGEGEAVYGIPVGDAEVVNAFGVAGGSAEHGDQAVRVGSSEASPVWDNTGPLPEQLSSIASRDKSG